MSCKKTVPVVSQIIVHNLGAGSQSLFRADPVALPDQLAAMVARVRWQQRLSCPTLRLAGLLMRCL